MQEKEKEKKKNLNKQEIEKPTEITTYIVQETTTS